MERGETETFEQARLIELKRRLLEHERSMKDERRKLWESEKDPQEGYTVWDRLEVLSMDILGYVSQSTTKGYKIENPYEVISHLHKLSIFNVECIMKWYLSATEEYPKIKQFFELLDYMRLLTIDYIQRYRLSEELTAK
jgi:hypothetical protein